ncbi:alpha/beta hydrolase [Streptomyces sp. ID05-47C]|uniref:alpha/beta fold hydrolase n=1 Tax=Streptomyces sp. ID05-47C TaxID=3028665 RepID=UPI0029A6A34C|nr:alpha/beta hydrolase [Streptomyces sp. ID05-47C]MDX3571626.1 alpha/beta hydrolase [Streptomyces sp. ID05-47C]
MTAYLTTPDGTRLAYRDHIPPHPDPTAPPVVLLHGLAGHLGEWDDLTARLLTDGHRVVRYDARGHGDSTRTPADVTRRAAVRDAVNLLTHLSLPPAVLLGQSLGGLTALLTAAAHPSRVASLILVEAGPAGRTPDLPAQIAHWLDSWPTPFPSRAEATAFLGHDKWADGLDWRPDGGHARVDRDTMIAAVEALSLSPDGYWEQWSRITCPTLVIRAERGMLRQEEAERMHAHRPADTTLTTVPNAAHDVHLDNPTALYEATRTHIRHLDPEPAEHARYAEYVRALAEAPPAEELALIRRILTDPDRQMAVAAVIRHLDRRGEALHASPPATWQKWAEGVREALGPTPPAFLLTRLSEWTYVHTLTTSDLRDPSNPSHLSHLSTASDWLQRRLTETPGVPGAVLTYLAEHGRTRRVRAAAGRGRADEPRGALLPLLSSTGEGDHP